MQEYEIIIIGGGSAGIAAAISAYENGCKQILMIERDHELGGILQQCIHNGFGLHRFHEELSGPAYAEKWIQMLKETNVTVKTQTMVIHLNENKEVTYVNEKEGYVTVKGKAVILAMGCRERTRGAIAIPGFRPSGIWTAGTAQRYLNMEGYLVGKRVFILGSGDIGLIMARRMTLEGAKVLGVAELMPYSNGLPRNMKQCLEDFNIPLYLSHTIIDIQGKERISGLTIAQVDDKMQSIEGTEKHFDVDTLLLSVGLIPENSLSEEAGIPLMAKTRGPVADEALQTEVPGIFACGNVLHVHDLVDFVSMEGEKAGKYAARYVTISKHTGENMQPGDCIKTKAGNAVSYVLPASLHVDNIDTSIEFMFRVTKNQKNAVLSISQGDTIIKTVKRPHIAPSEMEKLILKKEELLQNSDDITISVE